MPHFLIPLVLLVFHLATPFLLGQTKLEQKDIAIAGGDLTLLGGIAGVRAHRKRKANAAAKEV